ncbi:MAG TPA: lactonase family protein [Chryseosolibacter sp.]|nr:lactonase family protein [Chryseosolibacter sp.]
MLKRFSSLFLLQLVSLLAFGQREILYVGTYSVRGSQGIYVYEFDRKSATFNLLQTVSTPTSPTFVTIHPSGKYLYSVNRGGMPGKTNFGSVSSFSIDQSSGMLTLINQQSSLGRDPSHISTDRSGRLAFITNYNEANLVVYRIASDGSLGIMSDSVQFTGSSIDPSRQQSPHPHFSMPSPDNNFLLLTDLGTDKIHSFTIDPLEGKIRPSQQKFVTVHPGSGPRHLAFDPDGRHVYVAEELSSTVAAFSFAKKTGELVLLEDTVRSLPADFTGDNTAADIHTDASGKYLFMSNRGHESISVFEVSKSGDLRLKNTVNVKGQKPRNFLVDGKNQFLLVANQDTDNIVMFRLDSSKGILEETPVQIRMPSPACLKMLSLK